MVVLAAALIIVAAILAVVAIVTKNPLLSAWGLLALSVSVFLYHALRLVP